ncbi:MAG: ArgE/DapE family deacylase [Anaerolineae bacterium]
MDELKRHLANFLSTRQQEMVDFCARLVQTPSVNGQHPERPVAELIAAEARRLGLPAQLVADHEQRPNVIVSTGDSGSTGLLLVGHTDTVPPGDAANWSHPPFSAHIAEGRLYGRGAIDNKGGIAAALYALAALKAEPEFRGQAQFIGVPDEESGATGTLGVKCLTREGLLNAVGAIYVYPGLDQIPLGHRGLVRCKLLTRGVAAHTGSAGQVGRESPGRNAVTALAALLLALEQTELPRSQLEYFDQFHAVVTPGTVISGGTAINIVPDTTEALVDIRTIPEFDRPEAEALLKATIDRIEQGRPGILFEYELLNHLPAAMSYPGAPLFAALQRAARAVIGFTPELTVCGPANEGYLFIEQGIPIVCGFGPTGANAHAVDEYVNLASLRDAALIYALTALEMEREVGSRE